MNFNIAPITQKNLALAFNEVENRIRALESKLRFDPVTGALEVKIRPSVNSVISGTLMVDGSVIANKLTANVQSFVLSPLNVFSAVDYNTVQWSSATLRFADGKSYSINSGNTGNMTTYTYIYFDASISKTEFQITTNFSDVEGDHTVLVCVAWPAISTSSGAAFVPAVGVLGVNDVNIAANSISTNMLQANSVTAAKINVAQLSAISADMGTLTAGTITLQMGGTVAAGMTADTSGDAAVRIWAGASYANRTTAPFRVTQAGAVTATSATLKSSDSGKRIEINATDVNELDFFDASGNKIIRIGESVYGTQHGIEISNGGIVRVVYTKTTAIGIDVIITSSIGSVGVNSLVNGTASGSGFQYGIKGACSVLANGFANTNVGVYGDARNGSVNWAGYFDGGDVRIFGSLIQGSASQFQINSSGVVTAGTWNGTAIAAAYLGNHTHAAGDIASGDIATARMQTNAANAVNAGSVQIGLSKIPVSSLGTLTDSGLYVATSSGGSPNRVLGYVTLTIDGVTRKFLVQDQVS